MRGCRRPPGGSFYTVCEAGTGRVTSDSVCCSHQRFRDFVRGASVRVVPAVHVSEYGTAQHDGELTETGLHLWACEAELLRSLAHCACRAKRSSTSPGPLAETPLPHELRRENEHGIRVGERLRLGRSDRLYGGFHRQTVHLRHARRMSLGDSGGHTRLELPCNRGVHAHGRTIV
jgi:hypothetical protein